MKARSRRRRLLLLLAKTDGIKCFYCEKRMLHPDEPGSHAKKASIEHLVPRSLGGGEHGNNFVLAHSGCNRLRNVRPLTRQEITKAVWVIGRRRVRLFLFKVFKVKLGNGWGPWW